MLYEQYQIRVQQHLAKVQKILKTAAIILLVIGALCAAVLAFEYARGSFTAELSCPDMTYGEAFQPGAAAFFCPVRYEFQGEDGIWTEDFPTQTGLFRLRGKTVNRLGVVRYSNEVSFTLEPRVLSVSPRDLALEYGDRPELTAEDLVLEGLAEGDHVSSFALSLDTTLLGQQEVRVTDLVIQNAAGQDVTGCYALHTADGTATVSKRLLALESATASKQYDGAPLSSQEIEILRGSLAPGHRWELVFPASQTEIGKTENAFTIRIYDEQGRNVTECYELQLVFGDLRVTKRVIAIQTNSDEKIYDGEPLTGSSYELLSGSLLEGHRLSVEFSGSSSIPNTWKNKANAVVLDENGKAVADIYEITQIYGTLTIHKRPLAIKIGSASKVYDGKVLICKDYTITEGTLLEGHRLTVYLYSSITDPGRITNELDFHVLNQKNNKVTECYEFHLTYGTLEILGDGSQGGEDGEGGSTNFDPESWISQNPSTPSNATVFQLYSSETRAFYLKGMSYGSYNGQLFKSAEPYHSKTFPYDQDTGYQSPGIEASKYGEAKISLKYTESGPGTALLPYGLYAVSDTNWYTVNDVCATLSDKAYAADLPLYIADYAKALSSGDYKYWANDEELQYREYVYDNYLGLPEKTRAAVLQYMQEHGITQELSIEEIAACIQAAGTYNLQYDPIPADCDDIVMYFLTVSKEGVCQHFAAAGTVIFRALGYPARYVTGYYVQAQADQWVDVPAKNAHAWVEIYIDGFGWIPVEVTGSGTGEDQPPTVDTRPKVTIQTHSGSYLYDGTSFLLNAFYFIENNLQPNHEVHFTGSRFCMPEVSLNYPSEFYIYDKRTGERVTDQYNVTILPGTVEILPRKIVISTGSAHKKYDGAPLSCQEYTLLSGSLPEQFTLVVEFPAELTQKGSVENTPIVQVLYYPGGNTSATPIDVTTNFEIEFADIGTLTVF